ncbi:DUF3419 family protein [Allorhodopirellula heiligendammensis]|uniref:DUF3419 family protein n=1 Tax=Allorhodopirellula heiligendammensis TaxID=2714739 RepID=A0A5C6BGG0_9BACT|nr:DUF3419 family protein [Allorhodopirellula heiligendammensis]TWU11138.1 hypothetical protein Poly21_50450 [Allorhodopirellula heiligendammensis]
MWYPEDECRESDDWVAATAQLPIAFAQVREDPAIDLELVRRLRQPARILMVASGGDTACHLATMPLGELHLVDVNLSQLNLARFKLHLMRTETTQRRLELLGHRPLAANQRLQAMQLHFAELEFPTDSLGPIELLARYGADHCGRYEWLFARMRDLLRKQQPQIERLMHLDDPIEQSRLIEDGTELASAIQDAFVQVMDLQRLIQIFGEGATANRAQSFAGHFFRQTRDVLRRQAASKNPFLHQIFLGSFLNSLWEWHPESPNTETSKICFTHAAMDRVLAELPDRSYDFVHLSNILDWCDPADANKMLVDARRCLAINGLVVIRQLNSRLDIRKMPSGFKWLGHDSDRLHQLDRSFFYRHLHVGQKT